LNQRKEENIPIILQYIEGGKLIADLYREYKKYCQEQNVSYANYLNYYTVFNKEFNIGFFSPKKDQCELCLAFTERSPEEKTELQEKYDTYEKKSFLQ
jgi:hypothetical protein